jgi:hypothetical protein
MSMDGSMRNMYGRGSLPHFSSPVSYQRGRGLGSLLRGLFRAVRPIFKKPIIRQGLKKLGKAATAAAIEASQQVLDKDDVKAFGPALKNALKQQAKNALKKQEANSFLQKQMVGKGPAKRARPVSRKLSVVKRRRVSEGDIFS